MTENTEKIELKGQYTYGRGRRKEASARVRLYSGKGNLVVNGKSGLEYFNNDKSFSEKILAPLVLLGQTGKYDISAVVEGGGKTGQAEAIRLGISRALVTINEETKKNLRAAGFITRDPRIKERKKAGLKRARKAPQFSKR